MVLLFINSFENRKIGSKLHEKMHGRIWPQRCCYHWIYITTFPDMFILKDYSLDLYLKYNVQFMPNCLIPTIIPPRHAHLVYSRQLECVGKETLCPNNLVFVREDTIHPLCLGCLPQSIFVLTILYLLLLVLSVPALLAVTHSVCKLCKIYIILFFTFSALGVNCSIWCYVLQDGAVLNLNFK